MAPPHVRSALPSLASFPTSGSPLSSLPASLSSSLPTIYAILSSFLLLLLLSHCTFSPPHPEKCSPPLPQQPLPGRVWTARATGIAGGGSDSSQTDEKAHAATAATTATPGAASSSPSSSLSRWWSSVFRPKRRRRRCCCPHLSPPPSPTPRTQAASWWKRHRGLRGSPPPPPPAHVCGNSAFGWSASLPHPFSAAAVGGRGGVGDPRQPPRRTQNDLSLLWADLQRPQLSN